MKGMKKMKLTIEDFLDMKKKRVPVVATVIYEHWLAALANPHIDWCLCGDSAAMAVYGRKGTSLEAGDAPTMDCMVTHAEAVVRGAPDVFVVGDMPAGSYESNPIRGADNAQRFMDVGCSAIKLEGGAEMAAVVANIAAKGILVMGHIGLKPQSADKKTWKDVHGKTKKDAESLMHDAFVLEKAGLSAILLEKVAEETAEEIRQELKIPVFGIGAGRYTDGQLLLSCDILGSFNAFTPKFIKRYPTKEYLLKNLFAQIRDLKKKTPGWFSEIARLGFEQYAQEVRGKLFPEKEHVYHVDFEVKGKGFLDHHHEDVEE